MTSSAPTAITFPRRRKPKTDPAHAVYEIDLWLVNSDPPIWRSLAVPADLSLARLHLLIQLVMEWQECHMHEFQTQSGRRFEPGRDVVPIEGLEPMAFDDLREPEDESRITLRDLFEELKEKIAYIYDFGDDWVHGIKLIATHADASAFQQLPICLAGQRAGPPEDCGGPWGYAERLEILRAPDPEDGWHEEIIEWMGRDYDPEAFDIAGKNKQLEAAFRPRPKRASRAGSGGGTKRPQRKSR